MERQTASRMQYDIKVERGMIAYGPYSGKKEHYCVLLEDRRKYLQFNLFQFD